MTKGIIFNIQKFSIHDGPGIRTTVFLKGCPMRCKWCSNPESQNFNIQVTWDEQKCTRCMTCVNQSSEGTFQYLDNKIKINQKKVLNSLNDISSCPTKALKQEGEYKDVETIINICMQDVDFYEESNGGITISGGEAMGQHTFLKQVVAALKEKKLHVAIETTGYIASPVFQELAPLFDLLLFDVKHYNNNLHLEGTGVTNTLIMENLSWAIKNNIETLVRIPVIPTYNETLNDAENLASLLISLGIKNVQLLPFHQYGEKKYELLDIKYTMGHLQALYPEDLQEYKKIFLNKGLTCFF